MIEIMIETRRPRNDRDKCSVCDDSLSGNDEVVYIRLFDPDDNGIDEHCNIEHEISLCQNCLETSLGNSGLDVLKLIARVL